MPCGMQDLSSLTRNGTHASYGEVQSPNHQTTREVSLVVLLSPKLKVWVLLSFVSLILKTE